MTGRPSDAVPRAVIVTGGGTGIGRATARAFADQGAGVLVVGRAAASLDETARGRDAIRVLSADLTDPAAPELIAGAALRAFGRIDVLVNNAAAAGFAGLDEVTRDAALAQFETNALAPIFLTQCCLPALEAVGGTVVNVSTAAALGLRSWPGNAVHGASKAALDFLTRSWAVELAGRGVRVVGIAPGVVDSGVGLRMGMSAEAYAGFLGQMRARIPSGRVGRPEEIALWITRLTDPDAWYLNGVVLAVDGALSLT